MIMAAGATARCPDEGYWDRWPEIEVPHESPPAETIALEVVWRLDCGLDADELVGRIGAVAPGAGGRTLLLDAQLDRVLVVSPEGEIADTFGQAGEGPGDFPGSYRLFELRDGRVGVCGGAPTMTVQIGGTGKIVLLDRDRQPAGLWYGAGDPGTMPVVSIRELRCANDHVLTSSYGMVVARAGMSHRQELSILDAATGVRTAVACREIVGDLQDMRIEERDIFEPFASGRCDVSSSGRVAFAPLRDRWLVVVREADGTGIVLRRDWDLRERSPEVRDAVWKALGGTEDCVALAHEPAIGRVRWRPDGNLWVEPLGVDPGEEGLACFDEFGPDGALLRRVRVTMPRAGGPDELKLMEDGRFVVLRGFGDRARGDSSDMPEVVLAVVDTRADTE